MTETAETKLYGWYSQQMADASFCQVNEYNTPNGKPVRVTILTLGPRDHQTKWEDVEFVGEVTSHSKIVKRGFYFLLKPEVNTDVEEASAEQ